MNKLYSALSQIGFIEKQAEGDSRIHHLNPLLKIIFTLLFIVFVISTSYFELLDLVIYTLIISIFIYMSHVSFIELLKRSLVSLPISLCIGISNLFFMKEIVSIYGISVSLGILALIAIIVKNILCLLAVFLLISTTKFESIACELVHMKIPSIFVLQFVMIYRYIFLLLEEAGFMLQAYHLKNPCQKGVDMKDMGNFIGSLLVRSFKRSQDIYHAMKCRGFDVKKTYMNYECFEIENYFLIMMAFGLLILVKVVLP